MATTASAKAPARVETAGTTSSAPERTIMTPISVAMSEKSATRRDQMASRETGSSIMRRRTMADKVPVSLFWPSRFGGSSA